MRDTVTPEADVAPPERKLPDAFLQQQAGPSAHIIFKLLFIGVESLCKAALVSTVQQHESALHRHRTPAFWEEVTSPSSPSVHHRASRSSQRCSVAFRR